MPHTTCVVACRPKKDQYASHYLCGCLLAQGPVCLTLPVWLLVSPRRTSMLHTTCVVACRPKKDQYASHSWYGCLSAQHYKCVSQYASYPSVQDTDQTMRTKVKCNGCVYAMDTLSMHTLSHFLTDGCDYFVMVPSVYTPCSPRGGGMFGSTLLGQKQHQWLPCTV